MLPSPESHLPALDSSNGALAAAFAAYRRSGDPDLLAQVYDRAAPRLLAVALHLGNSEAAAEDAVQETFLVALEKADQWDPDRPLMPWLLGILTNKIRHGRRNQRGAPDSGQVTPLHTSTPSDAAAANEALTQIEQAIQHLAQPYRTVVILRVRNGLSPTDIALALGSNPATVRTQLHRGLTLLKRLLPASVASVLLSGLTAARGLDSVRDVVLSRASDLHPSGAGASASGTTSNSFFWPAVALGLLATGLSLWPWLRPASDPTALAPLADLHTASATPDQANEQTTESTTAMPPPPASTAPRRRSARGGLRIRVLHPSGALGGVPLELEPLADDAPLVLHRHGGNRGAWEYVASSRPLPRHRIRRAVTDERGEVTVSDLAPGRWLLRALDQTVPTEVRSDTTRTLDLDADSQTRVVRGRVIRADGQPVPGGRVWICREHVQALRTPAGRTDSAGYFQLAVAPFTTILVSHPEFAPVGCSVGREPSTRANIVFRLDEPGSSLTGRIVDPDGQSIRGATVQIGHPADARVCRYAATPIPLARPMRVRTDATGRFSVEGLQSGPTWVLARAPGYGLAALQVTLEPAAPSSIQLTLHAGATLSGRMIDARTGEAAAEVTVHAGQRGSLSRAVTTTDADGRYRLADLPAGHQRICATDHRGRFACQTVSCTPGSQPIWNGHLSTNQLAIAGRVITAQGQPFSRGWIVQVTGWRIAVHRLTDDGAFAMALSEREATYLTRIWAYANDPRAANGKIRGIPLAASELLTPGATRVEFRLPKQMPNARVRGRLQLSDSAPPARVFLRYVGKEGTWRTPLERIDSQGTFESNSLPAGRYLIVLDRPRNPTKFGPYEIPAGAALDVGSLREPEPELEPGPPASRRRFSILHPASALPAGSVEVVVRDAELEIVQTQRLAWHDSGSSDAIFDLHPGSYEVTAENGLGYRASHRLLIAPGEPQRRAIVLPLHPIDSRRTSAK